VYGAGGLRVASRPRSRVRHAVSDALRSNEMVFDTDSDTDRHARQRLRTDIIGWLTTVTDAGQPQTLPIWFLWDDDADGGRGDLLVYSDHRARRNRNIAGNPRVSLHLAADVHGNDVVIVEGEAHIDSGAPALPANMAYVAKYSERIRTGFNTPDQMAAIYNVPVRIRPTRGITF
jgi:PPOX class probable F420-dependent enzyme